MFGKLAGNANYVQTRLSLSTRSEPKRYLAYNSFSASNLDSGKVFGFQLFSLIWALFLLFLRLMAWNEMRVHTTTDICLNKHTILSGCLALILAIAFLITFSLWMTSAVVSSSSSSSSSWSCASFARSSWPCDWLKRCAEKREGSEGALPRAAGPRTERSSKDGAESNRSMEAEASWVESLALIFFGGWSVSVPKIRVSRTNSRSNWKTKTTTTMTTADGSSERRRNAWSGGNDD